MGINPNLKKQIEKFNKSIDDIKYQKLFSIKKDGMRIFGSYDSRSPPDFILDHVNES